MDSSPPAVPCDRFYDASRHLWVTPPGAAGTVRVGIDALGLEDLGELAYVVLPAAGTRVERGVAFGTFEAAKMTAPFVAPVSGAVVARNENAVRRPPLVNEDPYERGWLIEVRPDAWARDAAALITGEAAAAWAAREAERLRADRGRSAGF